MMMMNNLMLQQVMTIIMMIMIQVMVEKTMETLWTLLMPVVDHLVNLAATQGEMVDQMVKHNITMIILANHQDSIFQRKRSKVEIVLLI